MPLGLTVREYHCDIQQELDEISSSGLGPMAWRRTPGSRLVLEILQASTDCLPNLPFW